MTSKSEKREMLNAKLWLTLQSVIFAGLSYAYGAVNASSGDAVNKYSLNVIMSY